MSEKSYFFLFKSPKRDVPKHIQRPDYADHPRGLNILYY